MDEPAAPGASLTATQKTRREFASTDLDKARTADLAALPADDLILLVERLRNRLGDMLALIDEVTPD